MDTVNEPGTSVSQGLVTGEGPQHLQGGETEESSHEEGEVIGYFELDPSAGIQLMQGENTIYLPPEALGEHVLMSEGGKGCQQIIVVVEEGAEGTVPEAPFSDECKAAFVGDDFGVQQQLSHDAEQPLKHQQLLVLPQGNVDEVHQGMIAMVDHANAQDGVADKRDFIYTGSQCQIPEEEAKSVRNPEPREIAEKEHTTEKFASISGGLLDDERKHETILETAELNFETGKDSDYAAPELDLVDCSKVSLLTKETAYRNLSLGLDSTTAMQDSTCSGDLPSRSAHGASKSKAAVSEGNISYDKVCVPIPATDDATCNTYKQNTSDLASHKQECQQSRGRAVETTHKIGTASHNTEVTSNYSSRQEDSVTQDGFESQNDCLDTIDRAVESDPCASSMHAPRDFPNGSILPPSDQSEHMLYVRGPDSFPATLRGDYSTAAKKVSGDTFDIHNVSRASEADGKNAATGSDIHLGNKEIIEFSQRQGVPAAWEVDQKALQVEQEADKLDDAVHTAEPATESQDLQYSCHTLKELAKGVVDKHTTSHDAGEDILTVEDVEERNSPHSTDTFDDPKSSKIMLAGKEKFGSRKDTQDTLTGADHPNFTLVSSSIETLHHSKGARDELGSSNVFDTRNTAFEMEAPECSTLQSEGRHDSGHLLEEQTNDQVPDPTGYDKVSSDNALVDGAKHEEIDDVALIDGGQLLSDCHQNFGLSLEGKERMQKEVACESQSKDNDTTASCRSDEFCDALGKHNGLLSESCEHVESGEMTHEEQSVEAKEPERPSSSLERSVGEELMAALELVPCQEPSLLSTVGNQEEKLSNSSPKVVHKKERKRNKKSEVQSENAEDSTVGKKRWCLRTPTTPRKRMIIPDSDDDDFDSYETTEAPKQAQKSQSEDAFDALLNMFKMEQAKKAAEAAFPASKEARKARTGTAKRRRIAPDKRVSMKQLEAPQVSDRINDCRDPDTSVEVPPVTSTVSKPERKQKASQRKLPTPKKGLTIPGELCPGVVRSGFIRIRCQRPSSSLDKGTPQYHCSKCDFRSARVDNIVRHHKEECPHTKSFLSGTMIS